MIICVKGHPSTKHLTSPGWDLITDPLVRGACEDVKDEPNIVSAVQKLKTMLDPALYTVGRGGHHIYVASTTEKEPSAFGDETPSTWPLRHAMLVDTKDEQMWNEYPFLKGWD